MPNSRIYVHIHTPTEIDTSCICMHILPYINKAVTARMLVSQAVPRYVLTHTHIHVCIFVCMHVHACMHVIIVDTHACTTYMTQKHTHTYMHATHARMHYIHDTKTHTHIHAG